MTMNKSFIPWTITMMITGAVFITTFLGFMKDKKTKKSIIEDLLSKAA